MPSAFTAGGLWCKLALLVGIMNMSLAIAACEDLGRNRFNLLKLSVDAGMRENEVDVVKIWRWCSLGTRSPSH
eukprot:5930348-Amphidinium_carterae.1